MNSTIASQAPIISVVVPLYKEEKNVRPLVERLSAVFKRLGYAWELVFALDPSPDRTREAIIQLMNDGYPIRLLTFSRRIGKPLSLLAGLDYALGDASVVIDADLQDPPELIDEMARKWKDGYEVVIARRISRKGENYLYLKCAQLFYWILENIAEVNVPRDTGDFRLLDSRVVKQICKFRERHAFLRGLTAAAGFKTAIIDYDRDPRLSGKTQIPLRGAINIALDGIVPFSRTPVRLIFITGLIILLAGAVSLMTGCVYSGLFGLPGNWLIWFSLIVSTILSGITVTSVGVLGEYLVRTYEETRDRPLYIIDDIQEAASLSRKVSEATRPSLQQ